MTWLEDLEDRWLRCLVRFSFYVYNTLWFLKSQINPPPCLPP